MKKIDIPEIFHELAACPFLKCKRLGCCYQVVSGSTSGSIEKQEYSKSYSFKLKSVGNEVPLLYLTIYRDGRVKKTWGDGWPNVMTFSDIMDNYELSPKVKDSLAFYINIL